MVRTVARSSALVYKRIPSVAVREVRHYLTSAGADPIQSWLDNLRDRHAKVQALRRINRAELGNLGDFKFCRDGVFELRLDLGPGYRIYFARTETSGILLLCGGDKSTQRADIGRAVSFLRDWQSRQD